MDLRNEILRVYDLTDEYADSWATAGESADVNYDKETSGGELSKYSLLRQLMTKDATNHADALPDDEADPLGTTNSVKNTLLQHGIDIDNDPRAKGHYMISSKTFQPRTFLRDVHSDTTFANLESSLRYLERSLADQSDALRGLVEHNYDRFVKSKAGLDSVYDQFDKAGFNANNGWNLGEITSLIHDANAKVAMILKPVTDYQSKEQRLKAALELIEQNRYIFNLPKVIDMHIRAGDHEALVRDYRRGKDLKYSEEFSAEGSANASTRKVIDRIWAEVETVVDEHKSELWKELSKAGTEQNYLQLISKLLDLGTEDNPIVEWMNSRMTYLHQQAEEAFEKLRVRTNLMAVNLAAVPPSYESSFYNPIKLMTFATSNGVDDLFLCDSMEIIEMWLIIKSILDEISRLMKESCLFWETCKGFIDGQKQASLPTGYHRESRIHLQLSQIEVADIRDRAKQLAILFIRELQSYFTSPSLVSKSVLSNKMPKRSSHVGTESLLFMPPNANAIGASRYLSQSLQGLASALQEVSLATIAPIETEKFRDVMNKIREHAVLGVTGAMLEDSKKFAYIETWVVSQENKSCTNFPFYAEMYLKHVLEGLRDIVFLSAEGTPGSSNIIGKPSSRLIQTIYNTFVQTISSCMNSISYTVISGGASPTQSRPTNGAMEPYSAELSPQEVSQESKSLVTLSNFAAIRTEVLPKSLKVLERFFKMPSESVRREVLASIESFENPLFDTFTRKKKSILSEIVRHGILGTGTDWRVAKEASSISPFIHDALIELVVVHAKVTDVAPLLTSKVITVLYGHTLKSIVASVREVEQFSSAGGMTVVADIEFLRKVMYNFNSGEFTKTVENIYRTLQEASMDRAGWPRDPKKWVSSKVNLALQNSRLDYACFALTKQGNK